MEKEIPCIREGAEDERVRGTLRYFFALAGGRVEKCCGINKLEDYKGELNVEWACEYSHRLYANYLERAWYEFGHEPNVSHYCIVKGEEIHLSGENGFGRKRAA